MAYKFKEAANRYHRELYAWCTERGICAWCRKQWCAPGKIYCENCAKATKARAEIRDPGRVKRNAYNRERRATLKSAGICVECGKKPAWDGRTRCKRCTMKKRESEQVQRIKARIRKEAPDHA